MKSAMEDFIIFMFSVNSDRTDLDKTVSEFLEKEKQQIINSYTDGQSHSFSNYKDAEDYYNKVFKDK